MSPRLLSLCFCVLFLSSVRAELPPGSYDQLRKEADEAVMMQVTGVSIKVNGSSREVTVQARILRVGRSLSGLDKGDSITLKYEYSTVPFPGPRQCPLLRKNEVYPAFLRKAGNYYEPAAYGESFNSKPEGRR